MTALFLSDPTDDDPPPPPIILDDGEDDPLYEDRDYDDAPDEVFARAQDRRIMVHSAFLCLGCAAPLPAWRGSWCDACVERGE